MANNGMPSMLALLGLLAVAGYQNRDKIAGALNDLKNRSPQDANGNPDVLGGLAGSLGGLFGGGAAGQAGSSGGGLGDLLKGFGLGGDDSGTGGRPGTGLAGGLEDLLGSFRNSGNAKVADSWITPGVPTEGLRPDQVESAIGADNLEELSRRTGLSRQELSERLAKTIPDAVDVLTPGGHMPSDDELRQRIWPAP